MSSTPDLYESDYYVWALEQADLLRRREAGANALDYDNLADEVEALARSEARACESLLRQIVEHVLKILAVDESGLRDIVHRRREIAEFRFQLASALTPTLRLRLQERAAELIDRQVRLWSETDRELAAALRAHPPTLAQCLDEDWFPEAGARTLHPTEPA